MRKSKNPVAISSHRRRLAAVAVGTLLALLAVAAAFGQEALGGKVRTGDQLTIPSGETVTTDLYLSGGTIIVDGTVEGDLVAAGGMITVNGPVGGDVLAAGGTIRIAGEVAGDARLAGGQVTVDGAVGEDVLVAGGQVDVTSSATVGEDLIASGGQLTMNGSVTGSVVGAAGAYNRGGTVGGSDDVFVQPDEPVGERTVDAVGDAVRQFLVVLLIGLLALWLAPRLTALAAATLGTEPLRALGAGVVFLLAAIALMVAIPIVVAVVAIVLALLGFDALLAFEVLAGIVGLLGVVVVFTFLTWIVADVIVALGLARLVWRTDDLSAGRVPWGRLVVMLVVGAAVVVILTSLPIVGPWLKLLVIVLGVGALIAAWWAQRRRPRAEVAA